MNPDARTRFKVFLVHLTGLQGVAAPNRKYIVEGASADLRRIFESLGSASAIDVPGAGRVTAAEIESDFKVLATALIVPFRRFAKMLLVQLGIAFAISFFPALLMTLTLVPFPVPLIYAMFSFLIIVLAWQHRLAIRNMKGAFTEHVSIVKRLRYLELYLEFI